MRKYFCDRCGKELSRSEMREVTVDVGSECESGAMVGQQYGYELCESCVESLNRLLEPLDQKGSQENVGKE